MWHFRVDTCINKELYRAYEELWRKNVINAWIIILR